MASMRSVRPAMTPAETSECPLRYLVALCHTRSAPKASGSWFIGRREGVVDDHVRTASVREFAAIVRRSVIASRGLLGVSSKTRRVRSVRRRSTTRDRSVR